MIRFSRVTFTYPDAERPYRCIGYPVVPILYLLLPIYVLTSMFLSDWQKALVGIGFILLGAVVYYALGLNWRPRKRLPFERISEPPA